MQGHCEVYRGARSTYVDVRESSIPAVQEMSGRECADARWKVGPGHLEVKDLILLSLQRASLGTWVMSIEVPLRLGGNGVAGIQG